MARKNTLEINGERLWGDLMASASIGKGPSGGLRRLALGDDDKKMRDLFISWCESAGCSVSVDKVGNIFARRSGRDNTLPPVAMGSHLDTQIAGGKFDGILGVLSGLEVIKVLNDQNIETKRPVEVICWTNEEGVRFQPPMMGAGAFAGVYDLDWVLSQIDDDQFVFGEELKRIGYDGITDLGDHDLDSYFELHIEQGPELEAEGIDIGIVTSGFTAFGAHLRITGENAHSGPTPMRSRKNALVGAAMVIAELNEVGWKYEPEGRTTCSRIQVWPNKYGILPDHAEITIDMRHPDGTVAEQMYTEVLDYLPKAAKRAQVDIEVEKNWRFGDVTFDPDCTALTRSVAKDLGVTHRDMLSVAGHDAYHIAGIAPTALIFTPCKDGISHNENEDIELGYTIPGVNVLLHAVLRRANG